MSEKTIEINGWTITAINPTVCISWKKTYLDKDGIKRNYCDEKCGDGFGLIPEKGICLGHYTEREIYEGQQTRKDFKVNNIYAYIDNENKK